MHEIVFLNGVPSIVLHYFTYGLENFTKTVGILTPSEINNVKQLKWKSKYLNQ